MSAPTSQADRLDALIRSLQALVRDVVQTSAQVPLDRLPWLNTFDLAQYLRILDDDGKPSREGARKLAERRGFQHVYRDRTILYARADVDRYLVECRQDEIAALRKAG